MNVIFGCEESQACCLEFRKKGHNAFSCDIQDCSGGHPEFHFKMDVFKAIKGGYLTTQSGGNIFIDKWHMGFFFPDCTYITVSANKWLKDQPPRESRVLVGQERRNAREKALILVRDLMNCGIEKIGIENPIGVIGSRIFLYTDEITKEERWEVFPRHLEYGGREPDQIIQPWMFGHGETKATCLWLKNLPKLEWSDQNTLFYEKTSVKGREQRLYNIPKTKDRAKIRSKTFPGIAKAMAEQWGKNLKI